MRRDYLLDSFRGLMLVVMAIDHMTSFKLSRYTYETYGFISAAEGFFFLSGFVYGMVYQKYLGTPQMVWKKSLNRVKTLYLYHVGIMLFYVAESLLFKFMNNTDIEFVRGIISEPFNYGIKYLLLLYHPGWFNILPLYIVFLLFAPVSLFLFKNGKAWIVFLISITFWLAHQFKFLPVFEQKLEVQLDLRITNFNLFAWQIIFVAGVYFGYLKGLKIKLFNYRKLTLILAGSILVFFIFLKYNYLNLNWDFIDKFNLKSRNNLGIIRLTNFLVIAYFLAGITRNIQPKHRNYLSFLGQYSLDVYVFHIIIITHYNNLFDTLFYNSFLHYVVPFLLIWGMCLPAVVKDRAAGDDSFYKRLVLSIQLYLREFYIIPRYLLLRVQNYFSSRKQITGVEQK